MAEEPRVHHLFATPLIETTLARAPQLNAALVQTIRARQQSSEGIQRSNLLGWHSDSEMLSWGGEAAKELALETLRLCSRYTTDIGMKNNQPRYEMGMEMWANVSPAGSANQNHCHPGALWSAVYYIDDGGDPEGGPLMLVDPRFPMKSMYAPDLRFADESGKPEEVQYRVTPVPGKLILFPSWLLHGVKPHSGARDRISIAMNVMAMPRKPPPK